MAEVGMYEAKTHFAELVARAQRGERVTITKRGKPVAELTPSRQSNRARAAEAWDRLMEVRKALHAKGVRVTREEIKAWINEGRR